jgi:hypothetical protein
MAEKNMDHLWRPSQSLIRRHESENAVPMADGVDQDRREKVAKRKHRIQGHQRLETQCLIQ